MKILELKRDVLIQEWLSTISSDASKSAYLLGMQHYTEFTKMTPEELLDEAENEAGLLLRKRHIKAYFIGFKNYLTDRGLAPLSVKSYITAVKAFYRFFDIELPNLPMNKVVTLQENNNIPNKRDLQEVLKVCDPLEKAVLLTGAASGLSAAEIINLKISDFKKGQDSVSGITTLRLRRQKTNTDFVTFLTPEATAAVNDYLNFRKRNVKTGELKRQRQLAKQRVLADTGYLFCRRSINHEFLESQAEEERKFTKDGFIEIYRRLSEKAQMSTPKNKYNLIRSHNIRKWFNSTLLNSGCDFFTVEELMGHHLPATQDHYFRASTEKLKEIYKKYVPYLTIQKELDVSEAQEFKDLIEEKEHYKALAERYFTDGVDLLKAQIEITELKARLSTPEEKKEELVKLVQKMQSERPDDFKLKKALEKLLSL